MESQHALLAGVMRVVRYLTEEEMHGLDFQFSTAFATSQTTVLNEHLFRSRKSARIGWMTVTAHVT